VLKQQTMPIWQSDEAKMLVVFHYVFKFDVAVPVVSPGSPLVT
jgi:hypothetical protein